MIQPSLTEMQLVTGFTPAATVIAYLIIMLLNMKIGNIKETNAKSYIDMEKKFEELEKSQKNCQSKELCGVYHRNLDQQLGEIKELIKEQSGKFDKFIERAEK